MGGEYQRLTFNWKNRSRADPSSFWFLVTGPRQDSLILAVVVEPSLLLLHCTIESYEWVSRQYIEQQVIGFELPNIVSAFLIEFSIFPGWAQ